MYTENNKVIEVHEDIQKSFKHKLLDEILFFIGLFIITNGTIFSLICLWIIFGY